MNGAQPLFTYFDRFGNKLDPAASGQTTAPFTDAVTVRVTLNVRYQTGTPIAVVHQRPGTKEQPMRRLHSKPHDERGSIVIAMMVIFVATGLIVGVVALIYNSMKVHAALG